MQKPIPVDSVMHRDVVTIDVNSKISDAIDKMKKNGIGKIVVTIDDRPSYLLEEWRVFTIDPNKTIKEVLDKFEPITTILSETPIDEAKRLLSDRPAIVVLSRENNKMLGIVTLEDFIGYLKKSI